MYSLYYPFYAIEEADEQQIKKAKIGHLGLLAQTCLKYSYEFDLVIQAADTYSSSFTLKSDPSKKKVSHAQKSRENDPDKKREEMRKKLKKERANKRLDKKLEELKRQQELHESDLIEEKAFVLPKEIKTEVETEIKEKNHYKMKSSQYSKSKSKYQPYQRNGELKLNKPQYFPPNELLNFYENNTNNDYKAELYLKSSNIQRADQTDYYNYNYSENNDIQAKASNKKRKQPESSYISRSPNQSEVYNSTMSYISPFSETFVDVDKYYYQNRPSKQHLLMPEKRSHPENTKHLRHEHNVNQNVKKDLKIPIRFPVS